jgi:hypothetical protein
MEGAPSTLGQIILLTIFVLPGVIYQFARERFRPPGRGELDIGERVLRAIAMSVLLDGIYLVIAGPEILGLIKTANKGWFAPALQNPRSTAIAAMVLFAIVPFALAWTVRYVLDRNSSANFRPIPTAWDAAFRNRPSCFIRARLKSGEWVGGWYGKSRSHAAAYPQPADLFLEFAFEMGKDGSFGPRVEQSSGLYLRADDIEVIEFIDSLEEANEAQ